MCKRVNISETDQQSHGRIDFYQREKTEKKYLDYHFTGIYIVGQSGIRRLT